MRCGVENSVGSYYKLFKKWYNVVILIAYIIFIYMKHRVKHHIHLAFFFLIVSVSVVWTMVLLGPNQAQVKEPPVSGYVPGKPENLTAQAVSEDQISLAWQAPYSNEFDFAIPDYYAIYRSLTGNDFSSVPFIDKISSNATIYKDVGLTPGTKYYYKVAGISPGGEGENSDVASATTPASVAAPTSFAAEAQSAHDIRLHWDIDTSGLIDGYDVYRRAYSESSYFLLAHLGVVGEYVDTGLGPQTTYTYYVVAKKGVLVSSPSNTSGATTFSEAPAYVPPVTPTLIVPPAPIPTSTLVDSIKPIISQVQIVPDVTSAKITWQTNELADSVLEIGQDAQYGMRREDKNMVTAHSLFVDQLLPNTTYHFRLSSTDGSQNKAQTEDSSFVTLKKTNLLKDVSNVDISTSTGNILLTWVNPTLSESPDFEGVMIVRKIATEPRSTLDGTIVFKGKGELFSDPGALSDTLYVYKIYSFNVDGLTSAGVAARAQLFTKIPSITKPNICDVQRVDCTVAACKINPICKKRVDPTVLVDETTTTRKVRVLPPTSIFSLFDLNFIVQNNALPLSPNDGSIAAFPGESTRVVLPKNKLVQNPQKIYIQTASSPEPKEFSYDKTRGEYFVETLFPGQEGLAEGLVTVQYSADNKQEIRFLFNSLPKGSVYDGEKKVTDGLVYLLDESGAVVNTLNYNQQNPQTLSNSYGWEVPNGRYFVRFSKQGYGTVTSSLIVVRNNVINTPLRLEGGMLRKGLPGDLIRGGKNNLASLGYIARVASPVVAGFALISLFFQISLFDLIGLLRLLFLQPVLLIAARKREAWGHVYNSLNKLPVDLALVRLIDQQTNRVVQSMVTGKGGKYYFKIGPGSYRIEVVKDKMKFPSDLLMSYKNDGRKTDIYHGEILTIRDQYPIVNANIPGDPFVEAKTPARLRVEKFARIFQFIVAISGILFTIYSLYLTPYNYKLWLILGLHIVVFAAFYRLSLPPRPKEWGVVFDARSKRPLSRAVVRLFNTQFNKLVSSQISDHQGRYYFLAGDSQYQLSFERPEYLVAKSNVFDLNGKEEESIALHMGLQRKD